LAFPTSGGQSENLIITPINQFAGVATLTVPLINLADYWRTEVARLQTSSSKWQEVNIALQVESRAVQAYYQIIADLGLVAASTRALEVAKASLALAQTRFQSGKTAALDVDRAEAEVERQVQQLAVAQFQLELDKRSLRSLTGIAPDTESTPKLRDDLHEEPPLDTFQTSETSLPSLAAAMAARRVQEQQAYVQRLTLLPALAGSFTEQGTNAAGFSGHEWYWQAMLTLTWSFDLTSVGNIRLQDAQVSAAAAQEERVRLTARDSIHRAWNMVQTDIARSRSVRKQAQVSRRAAVLAHDRYTAGAATQLDLLQAERDAFSAEINQIQADADLANARAQLRLASGRSLVARAEVKP
jgi:outer membrane protein TolC